MKHLFTLILTLLCIDCYSQYWKNTLHDCPVNHKCKASYHQDIFENITTIVAGSSAKIGGGKPNYGTATIMFKKNISESGNDYLAEFDSNKALNYTGCSQAGSSSVSIVFSDGKKITLESVDKLNCNTTKILVVLSDDDIKILQKSKIDQIRMNFVDGPIDFVAKEGQMQKLQDLLNCVITASMKSI